MEGKQVPCSRSSGLSNLRSLSQWRYLWQYVCQFQKEKSRGSTQNRNHFDSNLDAVQHVQRNTTPMAYQGRWIIWIKAGRLWFGTSPEVAVLQDALLKIDGSRSHLGPCPESSLHMVGHGSTCHESQLVLAEVPLAFARYWQELESPIAWNFTVNYPPFPP